MRSPQEQGHRFRVILHFFCEREQFTSAFDASGDVIDGEPGCLRPLMPVIGGGHQHFVFTINPFKAFFSTDPLDTSELPGTSVGKIGSIGTPSGLDDGSIGHGGRPFDGVVAVLNTIHVIEIGFHKVQPILFEMVGHAVEMCTEIFRSIEMTNRVDRTPAEIKALPVAIEIASISQQRLHARMTFCSLEHVLGKVKAQVLNAPFDKDCSVSSIAAHGFND